MAKNVQSINMPPNRFQGYTVDRVRYLYEEHLCNRSSTETESQLDREVSQYFGTRPNSWMLPLSTRFSCAPLSQTILEAVPELLQDECDDKSKTANYQSSIPPLHGSRMKHLYESHWLTATKGSIECIDSIGMYCSYPVNKLCIGCLHLRRDAAKRCALIIFKLFWLTFVPKIVSDTDVDSEESTPQDETVFGINKTASASDQVRLCFCWIRYRSVSRIMPTPALSGFSRVFTGDRKEEKDELEWQHTGRNAW